MNEDSLALASLAASPKEDEDALAPLGCSSLAVEAVRETGARAGEYEVVEYETKGDKEVDPDGEYAVAWIANTLRGASCFFRFAKGGRVGSGLSEWLGFVPCVRSCHAH